jgi:hypothetical protein
MSRDVSAEAGFLCDIGAMLGERIKETPCRRRSLVLSASLPKYKQPFLHARVDLVISQGNGRQ